MSRHVDEQQPNIFIKNYQQQYREQQNKSNQLVIKSVRNTPSIKQKLYLK